MSETTERSAYDKLSPQRKQLADMLVANLDSGGLWKQGWRTRGAPENAVTGKKYRGVNNLYLFLVAMERGYSDNRWLTFNQMKARDWSFKTDAEGKSLGKNAGVSVEFFDLWDRDTHEKFDRSVLDGMSADERQGRTWTKMSIRSAGIIRCSMPTLSTAFPKRRFRLWTRAQSRSARSGCSRIGTSTNRRSCTAVRRHITVKRATRSIFPSARTFTICRSSIRRLCTKWGILRDTKRG